MLLVTRRVVSPAAGGLSADSAAEFTLDGGVPSNAAATGLTPRQLPVCTSISARANFNTGPNLHTGALHTGPLFQRQ